MFSIKTRMITTSVLIAALATAASGQQGKPAPRPAEKTPAPVDTHVETQGFKGKVFEIKYRDPATIARAVNNLGSGFKGAAVSYNQDFNTVTVRDFPENIAAIEEAIKRLDTPAPPRPDIEFRMHVLIASDTEGAAGQYPSDLGDVIKQLQATLNYKSYHLLTSIVQRAKEGTGVRSSGVAQVKPPLASGPSDAGYNLDISQISIAPTASGPNTVQIRKLDFHLAGNIGQARITSELGLREGEKVVVGTASLRDKAMVLVLTARVIK
jgi:hypothetical protein